MFRETTVIVILCHSPYLSRDATAYADVRTVCNIAHVMTGRGM